MESLELNKAAAAVLVAGITFMLAGQVGELLVHPHKLEKTAIKIEGGAAEAPAEAEAPLATLLASADVARGAAGFKAAGCVACHSVDQGGKNGIGPNLYGAAGAAIGGKEFAYSAGLKGKGGNWTFEAMNDWLKKPAAFAAGTKMTYAGLADGKKRADIMVYLNSITAAPLAIPAATKAAEAAPAAGAAAGTIKERLASANAAAGQAAFMSLGCIACHTFAEGGKAGLGPNLYNVVAAPKGHMEGFQYSAALKGKGGNWSYDELDAWLAKPAAFAAGTKMTFAGVPDAKKRADVIMYLRSLAPTPAPLP